MRNFFRKPFRWAISFSLVLTLSVSMVLLDSFVIPRAGTAIATISSITPSKGAGSTDSTAATESGSTETAATSSSGSEPVITTTSYSDDNIQISIETVVEYNTTFYVVDIQVTSAEYLKTAFASNTYGRNFKDTTSSIAAANNAILAINGDYYGFRDDGYVLRNGVLYRDSDRSASSDDALIIDSAGNFSIVDENSSDAQTLIDADAWQVFSFGPALVNNGEIAVDASSEVDQSKGSNPRTAIGQVSALHYIIIVSDGRTSESAGLSLLELAQEFQERGSTVAYNLDGGGSATLWFNGEIINKPTTNGQIIEERSVSDIVYFGY